MCGIVGACGLYRLDYIEKSIDFARDSLFHRGPDSYGTWTSSNGSVVLGHRRLSVVDLSPSGHQPMSALGMTITFNGEIYNYKELRDRLTALGYPFVSNSDTEVLIAAYKEWGASFIRKLNGMFAFGLYDQPNNKLILVRDRAGEKPLYYYLGNKCLYFASELKALLALNIVPRKISNSSFGNYLRVGYVGNSETMLQGVKKLPAGHTLTFDLNTYKVELNKYWGLPSSTEYLTNDDQILSDLNEIIHDSVGKQLEADVPVGILLSGGVDSSLITAYASEIIRNVQTYTVTFKKYQRFDESGYANLISNHFSTNHTEIDGGEIHPDILPLMAKQFDEPIADSSMIPTYLVSKLVKKYCTVGLGGDGGDEVFGGYYHYSRLIRLDRIRRALGLCSGSDVAKLVGKFLPVGLKGRNYLNLLSYDLSTRIPDVNILFYPNEFCKLYPGINWHNAYEQDMPINGKRDKEDLLNILMRHDFENYLCGDILVKVDRASMLASLEMRSPLLDYRLVDYSFSKIPPRMKATSVNRKILLKTLLRQKMGPNGFDFSRKQGFSVPISSWLKRGIWRDYAYDIIDSSDSMLGKNYVRKILGWHGSGVCNNSERIFMIILFELWRREYNIGLA